MLTKAMTAIGNCSQDHPHLLLSSTCKEPRGRWRDRGTHRKVPVGQGVPEDQGDLEGQVVPSQLFLEFQEFLESLGVPGVLGVLEVPEGRWAQEVLPSFLKDKIQCYICSH